jgi:hypothetical protein
MMPRSSGGLYSRNVSMRGTAFGAAKRLGARRSGERKVAFTAENPLVRKARIPNGIAVLTTA